MADQRITDLTEYTGTVADDDWFEMVDKSDTTDNAAGSSFKVAKSKIAGTGSSDPLDGNAIVAQRMFVGRG